MKNIRVFLSENFQVLEVKISIIHFRNDKTNATHETIDAQTKKNRNRGVVFERPEPSYKQSTTHTDIKESNGKCDIYCPMARLRDHRNGNSRVPAPNSGAAVATQPMAFSDQIAQLVD